MRFGHAIVITTLVATDALVQAQVPVPESSFRPARAGAAAIQVGGSWSGAGDDRRYTGGSWITVDYGRPILRGRENIFGTGATYGKLVNPDATIWRAGANATTRRESAHSATAVARPRAAFSVAPRLPPVLPDPTQPAGGG
jgi:hypothetical protein